MTRADILKKLESAFLVGHFEAIASAIDKGSLYDAAMGDAFRARLLAAGITNYPRRLCDYALRIMDGEPISEEIFKVFWLAESLSISVKFGLGESQACMKELAD